MHYSAFVRLVPVLGPCRRGLELQSRVQRLGARNLAPLAALRPQNLPRAALGQLHRPDIELLNFFVKLLLK